MRWLRSRNDSYFVTAQCRFQASWPARESCSSGDFVVPGFVIMQFTLTLAGLNDISN